MKAFKLRIDNPLLRIGIIKEWILFFYAIFALEFLGFKFTVFESSEHICLFAGQPVNITHINLMVGGIFEAVLLIDPEKTICKPLHPIGKEQSRFFRINGFSVSFLE